MPFYCINVIFKATDPQNANVGLGFESILYTHESSRCFQKATFPSRWCFGTGEWGSGGEGVGGLVVFADKDKWLTANAAPFGTNAAQAEA